MIIIGYYMIGFVSNAGTFFLMWLICILTEQSAGEFALICTTQKLITSDGTFLYPYDKRMWYFDTLIEKF